MNLIESFCTKSDCYKAGETITPKGLMLHSVGCNQPKAEVFRDTWNKPDQNVCASAVIGVDGMVIQTLPWRMRGWHGGGSSNDTHIGVEMTEPRSIRYISGAEFEFTDKEDARKHVKSTYKTAVELFASLCKEFKLDPKKKGVIVSHSEGNKLGIASAHADPEHLWREFGLTMDDFREDVAKAMKGVSSAKGTTETKADNVKNSVESVSSNIEMYEIQPNDTLSEIADAYNTTVEQILKDNPKIKDKNLIYAGDKIKVRQVKKIDTKNLLAISGDSVATEEQMVAYVKSKGVSEKYASLAGVYLEEGRKEGIRGDIAFSQSILETGYFKFGGDVAPEQNNFAGLGSTGKGVAGESFSSPEEGIRAQIQHLKAYANSYPLYNECVDSRFKYVTRGVAPYVEWLGIPDNPEGKGWASAKGYGDKIISILADIIMTQPSKSNANTEATKSDKYYVMLSWDNKGSKIGTFSSLDYAKKLVDTRPEYNVYDDNGKLVYKGKGVVKEVRDKDVVDYLVNVKSKTLVYAKPDSKSAVVDKIAEKGVYTIVAENNGYGKLKSGVGYIKLSDTSRYEKEVFKPYIVKVVVSALNIRETPNGGVVGIIRDKGCYTIVEENGEWGRLKSGAGWINLKFTDKI